MKIFDLLQKNDYSPQKTAVTCDNSSISYEELTDSAKYFSRQLEQQHVQTGDHVAIVMNNSIDFIRIFFAINYIDAVIVPIYPNTGIMKIAEIIKNYDIKYIITDLDNIKNLEQLLFKDSHVLLDILLIDKELLVSSAKNSEIKKTISPHHNSTSNTALILLSSGTTGIPKAIMLSNENIISNVKSISNYLHVNSLDNILLVKNLNHSSSITGEMLVSLYNNCHLYMTSRIPMFSSIIQLMDENKITIFFAVPLLLIGILNSHSINKSGLLSLRIIHFYGASMAYSQIEKLAQKLPHVELIYSYGLTEASPRVTYIKTKELLKRQKSSGIAIDGVKVTIRDQKGRILSHNEHGEIVVEGPNIMQGYYKNPELTENTIKNNCLFTGDLGYMDHEGYLYVTGRKDNLIIQGGKNIYPEEIESVLIGYSGIKEVLVKGEEDELLGNKIVAYLVTENNSPLDIKGIITHCRLYMEDYKIPREFKIIKEFEKTISGKIKRK